VKVWEVRPSKVKALELLMRHLRMLDTEQVQERPAVPAFALPPDTQGVSVH
jgi:hypothetical protein